jgi:antitoxin VapB
MPWLHAVNERLLGHKGYQSLAIYRCNIQIDGWLATMSLAADSGGFMAKGSVFTNNRSQAVRLPLDTRFPVEVKQVEVRVVGQDRILSPAKRSWDSFFLAKETVTDDFLAERANQAEAARESF